MILGTADKQPADVLDYDVMFGDWLDSGDTIVSATATSSDPALSIDAIVVFPTRVKVWLSAGVSGAKYKVTVTAVTSADRTLQVEFRVKVKEW